MQEQYYIDWINSLDINDCIFVNTIEDLYQSNNNILLNIFANILHKKIEDINNEESVKNLNYLNKISFLVEKYLNYDYEPNDEINLKNNTILLVKFFKSKYPDNFENLNNNININENIEKPKSSENIKRLNIDKYSLNNTTNEKILFRNAFDKLSINEENKNNDKNYFNKTQIEPKKLNDKEKKMEEFIINYLYNKGIIKLEQKNSEYFWAKLIPDLKDGYIIGKLINLLENKSTNYLKGISKETFYKVNINLNWNKIKDFLFKKESFNSPEFSQKNFFTKNKNIFYILYNICHYYYRKKELKNPKSLCKRSISLKQLKYNNKNLSIIKNDINMNNISSKEEILKVRQSLNYQHEINKIKNGINNDIKSKNKENEINKTEINNMNNNNKKGINTKFDKKVQNIISFLTNIGINTSNINFYLNEMKIFKDGVLLFEIISQLEPNNNILPKIDLNPKNIPNAINNQRLIIDFLIKYKNNFPIKFFGKEKELYNATPEIIIEFLFAIKNIYKNEIYYYEKNKEKFKVIKNIYPKNIDRSERYSLPLNNKLRNKFIIQNKNKVWA